MKKQNKAPLTEIVIDLNEFSPAERKMYDLGGFIAVEKYAPEPFRKKDSTVYKYYQCDSKPVSEHQITVPLDFAANRNIRFNLDDKTFLTTFAYLNYDMLCAVIEHCQELGWDKE